MAKLLIINDNRNLPLNNIGDVIAVYEDNQKLGTKEQEQIDSGLFRLVDIKDKTVENIHAELALIHPEISERWYDKSTGEWKELVQRPKALFKYVNGFSSNISTITANTKVVNDTIITAAKLTEVK
jgi:hypothetical protein